jgi:hypothetical protein
MESAILYEIRHWINKNGRKEKIIHGWILTRGSEKGYMLIQRFQRNTSIKSYRIMEEVMNYLVG